MLRGMVFENFVHFNQRYILDFSKSENGPNIFVGANSTGKTAVLELIRRCMDRKLNSSLTNRFNESETAYVFCEFKNNFGEEYGPTVISGMIVDKTKYNDNISDDEEDEEWVEKLEADKRNVMFHQVIMYFYRGELKFCGKTYLKTPNDRIIDLRKNVRLGQGLLDGILNEEKENFLTESEGEQPKQKHQISKGIKELFSITFAEKVSNEIKKLQKENKTYDQYPKMWGKLEDEFVGVLSMRGMGTFQWTKSRLIHEKFKSINYEGTCAQAEILTELLENQDIDKDREQKIFDFLTGGCKFHFLKKSNSEIVVQDGKREFALLKTSVGILEAKQFSLLMAHTGLKTICLEEPDRGMHPQMIERMKEVLHQESSKKTIIVVTHSPSLIDSTSLKNTFFFSRREGAAKVVNIYDELKEKNYLKLFGIADLKTLLFSSNVLFVEGHTDKIVLEAIIRNCEQSSKFSGDFFHISCHEIICMGGTGVAKKIKHFCSNLNIKFCLVLDRDAMIETDNSVVKRIRKDFRSKTKPMNEKFSDFSQKEFQNYSDKWAEEENLFIWKFGALEDFLLSNEEKRPDIYRILRSEKANDDNFHLSNEEMSAEMCTVSNPVLKANYNTADINVKDCLTDGISRETLDKLADIIHEFEETERLVNFLKGMAAKQSK